jgi:hypothetical protein
LWLQIILGHKSDFSECPQGTTSKA